MAIWQFEFALIPIVGILRCHGEIVDVLPEYARRNPEAPLKESEEFNNYWEGIDMSSHWVQMLAQLLQPMKSWSDEATMFGSKGGDCIEIWSDVIYCKIDATNFNLSLLSSMLGIADGMKCKLALKDGGRVIDPKLSTVISAFNNSLTAKYLRDPPGFLQSGERW